MTPNPFRYLAILICLGAPVTVPAQTDVPWAGYSVIDMTHSFSAETIYWPTEEGFTLETGFDGVTDGGFYYASNRYSAADHGGTHLDAPRHFAKGKQSADEVPLDRLMGPACVLDVSSAALADADYRLSVSDIEAWEARNGRIPQGCIVLLNTGYAQFWPDRQRYLGTSQRGDEGVENLHFPGYSEEAARALVARGIVAVGIDTASIDYGQSEDFLVHRYLYDLDIPGFENVANVDTLPATGAYVIALPMKIAAASGAPLRMIGLVPEADPSRPENFVDVRHAIPGIEIELRYFGSNNFTGRPIAGYEEEIVYLTREAASALGQVQEDLSGDGLGLKIFDGYRPQRAVDDFVRWAADPDDQSTKNAYYPSVDKSMLIRDGYIAERSGHSRGSTVDVTLIDLGSGEEIDMGSPYDFFDPVSWPSSTSIPEAARNNRMKLREIMMLHGFDPLDEEWWHFTLRNEPYPDRYFDFPVR